MKRQTSGVLIALTCAICTIGGTQPLIASAEESSYDYLDYETRDSDNDGVDDSIVVYGYDESVTEVNIPAEIDGLPVTSLRTEIYGNYWGPGCTTVRIPASVTSIGMSPQIGGGMFSGVDTLVNIEVSEDSDTFSSIDGVLFTKDKSELLCYPIGRKEKEYTIPDGVSAIGNRAFNGCTSLENVNIPDSLTEINDTSCGAFSNTALRNNQEGPVYYADNWVIAVDMDAVSVTIREGTVGIASGVFYNAAYNSSNVEKLEIPDSVKYIGSNLFSETPLFKDMEGPVYYIDNWVVDIDDDITSVDIRNGTIGIADGAFNVYNSSGVIIEGQGSYDGYLESVTLPESMKYIGRQAFYNRFNLEDINIPESVEYIGRWAFDGCTSIKDMTVSGKIGNSAFRLCSGLESVTLRNNVSKIGSYAFYGCTGITEITVPESVSEICHRAFLNCSGLERAVISEGVEEIGEFAFEKCSALTDISIPDTLTKLNTGIFFNCTNLINVRIPDNLTRIEQGAFIYCKSIKNIDLPTSVEYIGNAAFMECKNLESITINNPKAEFIDVDSDGCTISNYRDESGKFCFKGTVYGYKNSTAQAYAEKNNYKFAVIGEDKEIDGDSNGDGKLNVRDAAFIASMIAKGRADELPECADYNGDGTVNIRDAAAIAKYLATDKK